MWYEINRFTEQRVELYVEFSNIPRSTLKPTTTPTPEDWNHSGQGFERQWELLALAGKVFMVILLAFRFTLPHRGASFARESRVGRELATMSCVRLVWCTTSALHMNLVSHTGDPILDWRLLLFRVPDFAGKPRPSVNDRAMLGVGQAENARIDCRGIERIKCGQPQLNRGRAYRDGVRIGGRRASALDSRGAVMPLRSPCRGDASAKRVGGGSCTRAGGDPCESGCAQKEQHNTMGHGTRTLRLIVCEGNEAKHLNHRFERTSHADAPLYQGRTG